MNLKYTLAAVAVVVVAFTFSLQGKTTLSAEDARAQLQAGALLVDVRTVAEFKEKHLPGAVNIPLDGIRTGITNQVSDPGRVVLLHCRSGRRSAIAEKELRASGYTNVFNIGSYGQAEKIVGGTGR